jgi:hypothetical protein
MSTEKRLANRQYHLMLFLEGILTIFYTQLYNHQFEILYVAIASSELVKIIKKKVYQ